MTRNTQTPPTPTRTPTATPALTPVPTPPPTNEAKFLAAVRAGNCQTANWLTFAHGVDVNTRVGDKEDEDFGDTALILAAKKNDLEMVAWLISKKADISLTDTRGSDALDAALHHKATKTATYLYHYFQLCGRIIHPAKIKAEIEALQSAQEVQAQEVQAQEVQAQEAQAQEVQAQEVQAQEVQAQEVQAQAQEAQAQEARPQNYNFLLNAVQAVSIIGVIAAVGAVIAAATLLTGGALIGVAATAVAIGTISSYGLFKSSKEIQEQRSSASTPISGIPAYF